MPDRYDEFALLPAPDLNRDPTLQDEIDELVRERGMRDRVYPSLIRTNRLTQRAADRQNRVLDAAIRRLREIQAGERQKHLTRDPLTHAGLAEER